MSKANTITLQRDVGIRKFEFVAKTQLLSRSSSILFAAWQLANI